MENFSELLINCSYGDISFTLDSALLKISA